jgi:hypothetical protein
LPGTAFTSSTLRAVDARVASRILMGLSSNALVHCVAGDRAPTCPAADRRKTKPSSDRFNAPELHTVCFAPVGWSGKGPTIGLGIPECEMQYHRVGLDGEPVAFVNRPQVNKNVRHWLDVVCDVASEERLFVMLHCDTPQQAKKAAKYATRKLPQHRRVALERMYDPQTRREPEKMD